ncbi:MAG: hypothetical protein QOI05_4048 [Bradyrhizobium sp.]|jgi:hypothetical protein|nr:hypothetical protein [Bradyrhizobium sp.]
MIIKKGSQSGISSVAGSVFSKETRALSSKTAWLLAALVPATFVIWLFTLVIYAAPEYDDYCYFAWYTHEGLIHTTLSYYFGFQGRVLPFVMIQVPSLISEQLGISILPAYSIALAIYMLAFVAGCAFAIVRVWNGLSLPVAVFMISAFVSAVLGATRDLHDLLYWIAALACFVPPGIISAVILGECTRAVDQDATFSWLGATAMALGGFLATICNEYTGPWLIGIVGSSFLARSYLGQERQARHHAVIAGAVVIGIAVVLLAPGNAVRLGLSGGLRLHDIGYLAPRALNYALIDLGRFLLSPTVIVWSMIAAVLTLSDPSRRADHRSGLLALGVVVVCLGCCCFQYMTAHLATGVRLVPRAQNQALILLFVGLTWSIVVWVRVPRVRNCLTTFCPISLNSVALPVILGSIYAVSLFSSETAIQLRAQQDAFEPFRQENIDRDRILRTSAETTVVIRKHLWKPSLLFEYDMDMATGCIGSYYRKTIEIVPAS